MSAQTTTIGTAAAAIVDALREHFADRMQQIGFYDPFDEFTESAESTLLTPALLLGMDDGFDPLPLIDTGLDEQIPDPTGRLPLRCYWSVRCVLSTETENLQQELPTLAAAVCGLVLESGAATNDLLPRRGNDWDLGNAVEMPEAVEARPGGFSDGAHGWDSWIVSWSQILYTDGSLPAPGLP